jgi:hypothetical protein
VSEFDLNQALGETYEYGAREVLPESYYPVIVHVGESGVSKERTEQVAQGDGSVVDVLKGNTPFFELTLDVYEGPFAGKQVTRKIYPSPGENGGALGRWLGACKAVTGMAAPTQQACQKFGVTLPNSASVRVEDGERPEQAYARAVRAAVGKWYTGASTDQRMAFMAFVLCASAWEGKRAIVKLEVEDYKGRDGKVRSNNNVAGFIPLTDAKKGLPWVRAVEFPKQETTKQLMEQATEEV